MRRNVNRLSVTILVVGFLPGSLGAQGLIIPTTRLESPTDSVRMNAFNDLQRAAYDGHHHRDRPTTSFLADSARAEPALAAALIQLLERENARIASVPAGSLSADYFDGHYTTLLVTVARIRDPASAPALLPGIAISGAARDALASFGDVALSGVMSALRSPDEHRRFAAVITLAQMLGYRAHSHLSDASTRLIAAALLHEAQDPASSGREQAIEGLLPLSSPGIRPVMERFAATDTTVAFHLPGTAIRYGIRDAARAWLAAHPR